MANNVRVKLNMRGVRSVLGGPGIQQDLMRRIQRVADKATAEARANGYAKAQYFPEVHHHKHNVAVAHAWPNMAAALDNNENGTLISAFDEARG